MALEDRGVNKQAFIDLLEAAKAKIYLSSDSLENFTEHLRKYSMGSQYHLAFILNQLDKLGLDLKDGLNKAAIGRPFFESLLRYSMNHSLREVKFKARIPIPNSYQLVGVADEGRAYINEGLSEDEVYTLKPGLIYGALLLGLVGTFAYLYGMYLACVYGEEDEEGKKKDPVFIKGACLISRSPVIHPGDGWFTVSRTCCESDLLSFSPACLRYWRAAKRQDLLLPWPQKCRGPTGRWCVLRSDGPLVSFIVRTLFQGIVLWRPALPEET
jgi:RNA-dependent RNA polymerase